MALRLCVGVHVRAQSSLTLCGPMDCSLPGSSVHGFLQARILIIYLFSLLVMLPSVVPRLATNSAVRVFPGIWKPLFLKAPFLGRSSVPTSFVSLFIFYILSCLLLKTTGCLSGCLMSSASIQQLFCGICSVFKCSLDEFVGEKVVSPSYSSTILGLPPPPCILKTMAQQL